MACFVDRAPCFPLRTCSISSRTNSPACVVGALPSRFAFRARSSVFFSGILSLARRLDGLIANCEPTERTSLRASRVRSLQSIHEA
jgi:hypothetical protein